MSEFTDLNESEWEVFKTAIEEYYLGGESIDMADLKSRVKFLTYTDAVGYYRDSCWLARRDDLEFVNFIKDEVESWGQYETLGTLMRGIDPVPYIFFILLK